MVRENGGLWRPKVQSAVDRGQKSGRECGFPLDDGPGLGTRKTGRTRETFVLCKMLDDQGCFLDTPERFGKFQFQSAVAETVEAEGNICLALPGPGLANRPADVLVDFWSRLGRRDPCSHQHTPVRAADTDTLAGCTRHRENADALHCRCPTSLPPQPPLVLDVQLWRFSFSFPIMDPSTFNSSLSGPCRLFLPPPGSSRELRMWRQMQPSTSSELRSVSSGSQAPAR